jgi:ABC-type branched-subunit amino acid transport system substrate-binding protein
VPWDSSNNGESLKKVNFPSWWKSDGKVEQRIAMSYDATLVLLNAMENADRRLDVQKVISGPHFKLDGITGSIDFDGSERKLRTNYLITPNCQGNECKGFKKHRA